MTDKECSCRSFLFSAYNPVDLYGPQYRASRGWNLAYMIWRTISGIYFIASIIVTGFIPWFPDGLTRIKWFIYLTNWAFLIFTLSQLWRMVVSIYKFITTRFDEVEEETTAWYLKVSWILYTISTNIAVLVTLLFWGLIYYAGYSVTYDIVVTHGINAFVIILIDFWITAVPVRVLHFYLPVIFSICWVLFSVIYDYAGGTNYGDYPYIYSVTNWTEDATWPAAYSVGAIIACAIFHFILFGLYRLRLLIYKRCCSFEVGKVSDVELSYHGS